MDGYTRNDSGQKSGGRLIALLGVVAGIFLMGCGGTTVLLCLFVVEGKSDLAGHGATLATIGAGVFTAAAGLKGWQKQSEAKMALVKEQ